LTPFYAFAKLGLVNKQAASVPRWLHFLGVVFFGGLMGAGAGWSVLAVTKSVTNPPQVATRLPQAPRAGEGIDLREDPAVAESPGGAYALALVSGDYDEAVDRTLWMTERLNRVRRQSGSEDAVTEARTALIESLSERPVSDNQISAEGVEDIYVFAPGATLRWLEQDEGRDDLEEPAARRDWIRVTYPSRARALRDINNIPIRSLVVGINTNPGGQVLKAGIIGNLDLDLDSIAYDWE